MGMPLFCISERTSILLLVLHTFGSMILHSEIGKGTAVTVLIPDASKNGGKERKT